jgi:hypothetical protein
MLSLYHKRLIVNESLASHSFEGRDDFRVGYRLPSTRDRLYDSYYSDTINQLKDMARQPVPEVEDLAVATFVEQIHSSGHLGKLLVAKGTVIIQVERDTFENWEDLSLEARDPLVTLIQEKYEDIEDVIFTGGIPRLQRYRIED